MARLCIVLLILAFIVSCLSAQEQEVVRDTVSIVEPDLESILENATQDAEDSELIDLLTRLEENPLDLNTATNEELQQIPGLDPITILNILERRERDPFRSIDDLFEIDGITPDIFGTVRKFVTVGSTTGFQSPFGIGSLRLRSRVQEDLQKRRGFQDGSFTGSSFKIYNRLVARSIPIDLFEGTPGTIVEIGALAEKDAGERRIGDHVAGYVDVRRLGPIERLIVGDYVFEAASGLTFWRSLSFGKGSDVLQPFRKRGGGIKPFLSTEENLYFRGAAATVGFGPASLSIAYSQKPLHATVTPNGEISSLYTAGYFRTESELLRRNTTSERMMGARLVYAITKGIAVGTTGYRARFEHPLALSGTFAPSGRDVGATSVDLIYAEKRVSAFAEVARDDDGTVAGIAGILFRPVRGFNVVVIGRDYPFDFNSFHGNGFGESDGTRNERGVYAGLKFRATSWLMLSAYYDHFRFPWRTTLIRLPSGGHDLLTLAEVTFTRKLALHAQYKAKVKSVTESGLDEVQRSVRQVGDREQQNYRMTLMFVPSITFRWRTRFELVNVRYGISGKYEKGYLIYQDIRIIPIRRLLIDSRVCVFETDSYDSRVYEFETDVGGTFSNPALYGRGVRWYVTGRYEVMKSLDVWFRYAATIREGAKSMSSGSSEIQGDIDNRFTLQLEVQI